MESIKLRLKALEQKFRQQSSAGELDLFCRAVQGDSDAAGELERIAVEGKTDSRLWEMYLAIQFPVDCHGDLEGPA
jgi:hypothetical protein